MLFYGADPPSARENVVSLHASRARVVAAVRRLLVVAGQRRNRNADARARRRPRDPRHAMKSPKRARDQFGKTLPSRPRAAGLRPWPRARTWPEPTRASRYPKRRCRREMPGRESDRRWPSRRSRENSARTLWAHKFFSQCNTDTRSKGWRDQSSQPPAKTIPSAF